MEYLLTIMVLTGSPAIITIIVSNKETCVRALKTNIEAVPYINVTGTCVQIRK